MAQVISPSPHLAPTTSHRVQKQVTWAPTRCCYWCGFCLAAAGWMLLSLNWLRITLLHTSLTLIWASWVFEYQYYLGILSHKKYLPLQHNFRWIISPFINKLDSNHEVFLSVYVDSLLEIYSKVTNLFIVLVFMLGTHLNISNFIF